MANHVVFQTFSPRSHDKIKNCLYEVGAFSFLKIKDRILSITLIMQLQFTITFARHITNITFVIFSP